MNDADRLPPSELETDLDQIIERVLEEGGTGYQWNEADRVVLDHLDLPDGVRFKKASGSGRAANTLIENPKPFDLHFVVVVEPGYSVEKMTAKAREHTEERDHLRHVAIAGRRDGDWRVLKVVSRRTDEDEVGRQLKEVFPAADFKVVAPDPSSLPVDFVDPTKDNLGELLDDFKGFLEDEGLVLDRSTTVDLLASVLSSQMLLFAGPSGTGKSFAARTLARFFAPPARRGVVEGRRQLIGPEDFVGYYSSFAGHFIPTADLTTLVAVSTAVDDGEEGDDDGDTTTLGSPITLVEEANLSPIEGYLNPVVHSLSRPSVRRVRWHLHAADETVQAIDEETEVPASIDFEPFPRFLGTINVDATAQAPSRKVSARSCVVLMEPSRDLDAEAVASSLDALDSATDSASEGGEGRGHLQDPIAGWESPDVDQDDLADELVEFLREVRGEEGNVSSHRDLQQALLYMAYFVLLAPDVPESSPERIAAENAFLHFMLPVLPPEEFERTIDRLLDLNLVAPASDDTEVGGLLGPRVDRLSAARERAFGVSGAIDFWAALS